jgi:hypothetical protein
MALAEAQQRGQLLDTNLSGKICTDMRKQPSALPSQQTSGRYLSIYGGSLWGRRCQDLISLQKCDRTCDVHAGSFAVTLTRFVRSFDELRRDN